MATYVEIVSEASELSNSRPTAFRLQMRNRAA
jgi:hypothetical protein